MKANQLDLGIQAPSAVVPPEYRGISRDSVKLLVLDPSTKTIRHAIVRELCEFLQRGDLVVVNDSAMIGARLLALHNGTPLSLHLAGELGENLVLVERREITGGPDWTPFPLGSRLEVVDGGGRIVSSGVISQHFHPRSRLWVVNTETSWYRIAQHIGRPIRYGYLTDEFPMYSYQTIFGRRPGSAEMPSASRPFTLEMMATLRKIEVEFSQVTLHTTVSSHEVDSAWEEHPVFPEWFEVSGTTACRVTEAMRHRRRVIALGTTVVRALESAYDERLQRVVATAGWTRLLITPEFPPRVVDGLITGLHDNFTSHLALLYAFVDPDWLKLVYRDAVQSGYLWHEFGDLCLIANRYEKGLTSS
ncbi:MAG: S-adenosylmethionine:tRNA ribosyltransferase-isomerase [Firmicutes bacterium]|nr:S-adenosylmethionine:tRNA ribosyltransferase-isomerase [Bacillota bacterium]